MSRLRCGFSLAPVSGARRRLVSKILRARFLFLNSRRILLTRKHAAVRIIRSIQM
jgi:hypothetical protein